MIIVLRYLDASPDRWPNKSLLATHLLDEATQKVLTSSELVFSAMSYGQDQGHPRLRKHLATWLTQFYQPADPVSEDRLCITGGASQNLACLLQAFTDPLYTQNIWIVAPAYALSFRIFDDAGFHRNFERFQKMMRGLMSTISERSWKEARLNWASRRAMLW